MSNTDKSIQRTNSQKKFQRFSFHTLRKGMNFVEVNGAQEESEKEEDIVAREEIKQKILNLLFTGDLDLLAIICKINSFSDGNAVSASLISLLQLNDHAEKFVLRMLSNRIESSALTESKDLTNVLRDNSMTVMLLTAFAKTDGRYYLKEVLIDPFQQVEPLLSALEINPSSLPRGEEEAKENLENLIKAVNLIFHQIMSKKERIPASFRRVCTHLRNECNKKLEEETIMNEENRVTCCLRLVGSFIFLRYFCPALTTPQNFGLTSKTTYTAEERRGLILTGKVFISLGAESDIAAKEDYLLPLNQRLEEHREEMRNYLDFLSNGSTNSESHPASYAGDNVSTSLENVIGFLNKNMKKLEDLVKESQALVTEFAELKTLVLCYEDLKAKSKTKGSLSSASTASTSTANSNSNSKPSTPITPTNNNETNSSGTPLTKSNTKLLSKSKSTSKATSKAARSMSNFEGSSDTKSNTNSNSNSNSTPTPSTSTFNAKKSASVSHSLDGSQSNQPNRFTSIMRNFFSRKTRLRGRSLSVDNL